MQHGMARLIDMWMRICSESVVRGGRTKTWTYVVPKAIIIMLDDIECEGNGDGKAIQWRPSRANRTGGD